MFSTPSLIVPSIHTLVATIVTSGDLLGSSRYIKKSLLPCLFLASLSMIHKTCG